MTLLQRDRENREIGREEGRAEGLVEGTQRMAILINQLIEANRYDEVKRTTTDTEYREKLFKEFGI